MSAIVKNRITRGGLGRSIFPSAKGITTASSNYNQGDLLCLIGGIQTPAVAEGDGATFLGIALETVVSGKVKRPYVTDVDAAVAISDVPGAVHGVVAKLLLKTGSSLNPGDAVSLDPATGPYAVQAFVTKSIGRYVGETAIVGSAAGLEIEVALAHGDGFEKGLGV